MNFSGIGGGAVVAITIKGIDEFSDVLDRASSRFGKLGSLIGGVTKVAAVGIGAFTTGLAAMGTVAIKGAADLEQQRQGFITLLGSVEKADAALEMIKKDAASTPFELPGLIEANKLLTTVTEDAQRSESFLLDIGKALAAAGKGQAELDRVIVNLQQIGSVGKASMLDIKQFAFAGIPIFKLLEEQTGLTGEALGDLISSGGVSFELLEEVFKKAGAEGGRFANAFSDQMGTATQMISNLKDTFFILGTDIVQSSGLFDVFKGSLSSFSNFLANNSENIKRFFTEAVKVGIIFVNKLKAGFTNFINVVKPLFETFKQPILDLFERVKSTSEDVFNSFSHNGEELSSIIKSIVNVVKNLGLALIETVGNIIDFVGWLARIGALTAVITVFRVITGFLSFMSPLLKYLIPALAVVAVAWAAWTIALWAFNAAMGVFAVLMSPITLIILAIVAAIAAVIFIIKRWGEILEFLKTQLEVAKIQMMIYKNAFLLAWELIKLAIATAVNFIVSSVQTIGNRVIDMINAVIDGLNVFRRFVGKPIIPSIGEMDLSRFMISTDGMSKRIASLTEDTGKLVGDLSNLQKEGLDKFVDIFTGGSASSTSLDSGSLPMSTDGSMTSVTNVNIENVNGLDPEEIGKAMRTSLQDMADV